MGIADLRSLLRQHRRVAIDTCIFVYQLEPNPTYKNLTGAIFNWLEESGSRGVTSTITMAELLVQPYRDRDSRRVDDCFALLTRFPNLSWVEPDLGIADLAASFRAKHRLKMPDALQAATAVKEQTPAFVTNDAAFRRVSELRVLAMDDLL